MTESERDAIAELLEAVSDRGAGETFRVPFFRLLTEFVLAAGFRPPAVEIVDPQQLVELPPGSIIIDYYGFGWQKSRYEDGHSWRRADGSELELDWDRDLPELILYVPPAMTTAE